MKKTSINVRVNQEEKKEAERVLENLGVSMSSAINMYIIQIAKQKKIPFEIKEETSINDEFNTLVKELDKKGEIKTYEEFLKTQDAIEYCVSEETSNYYWQTSNKYSIGDIVFVTDFVFKSGQKGTNHLFVIISENEAVEINFFGFILSSNLKKSTYPYNVYLKKTKENHLDKDSIVKCDDLIKIDKNKIKLIIGKVTSQDLAAFKEAYTKYKSKE